LPDVLWKLQGLQKPVFKTTTDGQGQTHKVIDKLESVTQGELSGKEFDRLVRDLITFLALLSEPYATHSRRIGVWLLPLVAVFTALAYALKREYWKDLHR
jgi:ubiquinol-cytochrome c reductase cytochrome c1 subunit